MYPYFVKLKNKHNFSDYTSAEERVSYARRISYTKAESIHNSEAYDYIPEEFRKLFGLNVMRITDQVPPHTDSRILTCINFYIKTQDAVTTFYEPVDEVSRFQIPNQTDGYVFKQDNLSKVAQFCAQPGDAFVLNVAKIHSVYSNTTLNERIALTLGTPVAFDKVCKMLAQTGNIEINKE